MSPGTSTHAPAARPKTIAFQRPDGSVYVLNSTPCLNTSSNSSSKSAIKTPKPDRDQQEILRQNRFLVTENSRLNSQVAAQAGELQRLRNKLKIAQQFRLGFDRVSAELEGVSLENAVLKDKLCIRSSSLDNAKKREKRAKGNVSALRSDLKQLEKSNNVPKVKPYNLLLDKTCKNLRLEKLHVSLSEICGSDDPSDWSVFLNDYQRQHLQAHSAEKQFSQLSGFESLVFLRSFELSHNKYGRMKAMLKKLCSFDVLSSLRQVKKEAKKFSTKSLYNVSMVTVPRDGSLDAHVPVLELNDLQTALKSRVENLAESNKLQLDGRYDGKIWACVVGDKGGRETKLGVLIGNVEGANSPNNLILCGSYVGDDSSDYLTACLPNVIREINTMKSVDVMIAGKLTNVAIEWFLTGDLMFLYSCFGHKGPSSSNSCLYCCERSCKQISSWRHDVHGVNRDLSSYAADAQSGLHSVYLQSSVVFKNIDLTHVIPPSLHIFMGLSEIAFSALSAEAARCDADLPDTVQTKSQQKSRLNNLRKLVKEKSKLVDILRRDVVSAKLVHEVLISIRDGTIEQPPADLVSDEPLCAEYNLCVMRDRRAHALEPRMWDKCISCSADVHFECSGQITSETVEKARRNGLICMRCANLDLPQRIREVESELSTCTTLLDASLVDLNQLNVDLGKLHAALHGSLGAKARELDTMYRKCGGDPAAWFQKFCGNHVRKLLKPENAKMLWSIFDDSPRKTHFIAYMELLGELQGFAQASFLSQQQLDRFQEVVPRLLAELTAASPDQTVTPKLHVLVKHVLPFMRRFHTWGKMSEQCIEALHARLNRLNARYCSIRNPLSRYHAISDAFSFSNYLFDTNHE